MKNSGSMSLPPVILGTEKNSLDENSNKVNAGFKQKPIKDRYLKFALAHSLIYNNQVSIRN
jgi:hypothetical protein